MSRPPRADRGHSLRIFGVGLTLATIAVGAALAQSAFPPPPRTLIYAQTPGFVAGVAAAATLVVGVLALGLSWVSSGLRRWEKSGDAGEDHDAES